MSKKKKKKEIIGVIRGKDILKATRPMQSIPCRTGAHMTEKDRPRKRVKPRDVDL